MQTTTTNNFSIGAAAKYLGVSIDTLRRWDKKGKLPSHRSLGGHRYFLKDDLDGVFNKPHHRQIPKREPAEVKPEQPKEVLPEEVTLPVQPQVTIETPAPVFQPPIVTEVTQPTLPEERVQISTEQFTFPQRTIEIPQATPVQITETQQVAITVNPQQSITCAEIKPSTEELLAKAKKLTTKPAKPEKEANGSILKIMLWLLLIFALIDLIIVIYLLISRSAPPMISPVP